jgi:hypothetical protein
MAKCVQRSECGGQMDPAQEMAKWELQLYANMEINGGPAAPGWALCAWRSLTERCGRFDPCII